MPYFLYMYHFATIVFTKKKFYSVMVLFGFTHETVCTSCIGLK